MGSLLDLFYPTSCVVCGVAPSPLCQSCQRPAEAHQGLVAGLHLRYSHSLDAELLQIMRAFKDRKLVALSGYLANQLDAALEQAHFEYFAVPPTNRSNFRKRGFHPIQHLVDRSRILGSKPQIRPQTIRQVKDQRELDKAGRAANLGGSLAFPPGSGQLLIIDDVVTTGATVGEMARAARMAGYQPVGICAIAYSSNSQF